MEYNKVLKDVQSLINFYNGKGRQGQADNWEKKLLKLIISGNLEHFPYREFNVHMNLFNLHKEMNKKKSLLRRLPTFFSISSK